VHHGMVFFSHLAVVHKPAVMIKDVEPQATCKFAQYHVVKQ